MKSLFSVVRNTACLFLLLFIIPLAYLIFDGLTDEKTFADIGIVFGNKVENSGLPSSRLQARLDEACHLFQTRKVNNLFVSGGLGKEGFEEAKVMKTYLMKRGIPSKNIFVDNNGINTFASAQNLKTFIEQSLTPIKSVVVITSYYHISRCKLALNKVGIHQVRGVSAKYFELRDFYSIPREVFAYYKYLFAHFAYSRKS